MPKGRKKLAPEIHEAKGDYKKNPQRRNEDRVYADGVRPEIPAELAGRDFAIKEWERLCSMLHDLGVIGSTDLDILKQLCLALHFQHELLGDMDLGDSRRMSQYWKCTETIMKILPQLGLTPASRDKVFCKPKKKDDPLQEIIQGMKEARAR